MVKFTEYLYSSKMTASMGWYTWYPLPDQRTVGSAVPNFSLNFLNVPFNARKWLFSLSNVPLSKSIKTKEGACRLRPFHSVQDGYAFILQSTPCEY